MSSSFSSSGQRKTGFSGFIDNAMINAGWKKDPHLYDGLSPDERKLAEDKDAIMESARQSSLWQAIATVCNWTTGQMMAAGMSAIAGAAASGTAPVLGIVLLSTSGVLLATAIASNYFSTNTYSSHNFDVTDHNAQRTAELIAKELAKEMRVSADAAVRETMQPAPQIATESVVPETGHSSGNPLPVDGFAARYLAEQQPSNRAAASLIRH